MTNRHHVASKGTTVMVTKKDGTRVIDKFVERKSKFVKLENHKIAMGEIRSLVIYKPQMHGHNY